MKYLIRSIESFLLALLLAFIFIFFFHEDQAGGFGGLVFIAGLIVFAIMLFRSAPHKVHFRFCLIFGIEWLLLPAIAYINLQFRTDTFGEALGNVMFLGLLTGAGIIGGFIFLSLAIIFFLRGRRSRNM
jgi:hypothetical protein